MKRLIAQLKRRYKNTFKRILTYVIYIKRFRAVKKNGKWMMKPKYETLMYDAMNLDINNTCNLRCRFCFNMFKEEPCYMSEEMFHKILLLFPLIRPIKKGGYGIFFSCLYEPSVSPHFLKFLKLVPREGRKEVFFTSNFCKPYTEEELRAILCANLHHINISVETLQAERYQEICSSVHFENFYHNMEKLSAVYAKQRGYKPKLYFVTMVLKENRDELASIVRFCAQKLHAARHDLRTPYISEKDNNAAWNRGQLMDAGECACIRQELEALQIPVMLDIHSKEEIMRLPPDTEGDNAASAEAQKAGHIAMVAHMLEEIRFCMDLEYLFIRFHPSGTCTFLKTNETSPISEIEDTVSFFKEKLHVLYRRRAKAFLCPDEISNTYLYHDSNDIKEISMQIVLDKAAANPVYLLLQGWIYLAVAFEEEMQLFVTDKKMQQTFFTLERPVPDWMGKSAMASYGFTVCMDYETVKDDLTELEFLFVRKRDLKALYFYRYPYGIMRGKPQKFGN